MMLLMNKSRAIEMANALLDAVEHIDSGTDVVNIDRVGPRLFASIDDTITEDTVITVMDDDSLYRSYSKPEVVKTA